MISQKHGPSNSCLRIEPAFSTGVYCIIYIENVHKFFPDQRKRCRICIQNFSPQFAPSDKSKKSENRHSTWILRQSTICKAYYISYRLKHKTILECIRTTKIGAHVNRKTTKLQAVLNTFSGSPSSPFSKKIYISSHFRSAHITNPTATRIVILQFREKMIVVSQTQNTKNQTLVI